MKKSLLFGGFFPLFVSAFLFSSCSKEEDGIVKEDMSFMHLTAVVDGVRDALRASWQVTDPNTEDPDYDKEEKFLWNMNDKLVALSVGAEKVDVQYNIEVTTTDGSASPTADLDVNLPNNGKAWFFYPSATITNVDTTGASTDVSKASVVLNVAKDQDASNQFKCVYLRTNEVTLQNGSVVESSNIQFNHLTSLLRFHLQNLSDRKYTVKQIKITSSSPTVFATSAFYNLTSQGYDVQSDVNNSSFVDEMSWTNNGYRTDAPLVKYTSGEHRDIYDALLVVLPVEGDVLKQTALSIYVTLYDTETGNEFSPNPMVLDLAANPDLIVQFSAGFPRGKRTYFNMRVSANNTLEFVVNDNSFPFPNGWNTAEIEL